MSISLADLVINRRELAIPFGDKALNVVYRPEYYNGEVEALWNAGRVAARTRKRSDEAEFTAHRNNARYLLAMLESWDLVDEKGKPVPLTPEGLTPIGNMVLLRIIDAIQADITPGKATPPV